MTIFKYTDSRSNAPLVGYGTSCIAVYMHGVGTSAPVVIPNADVPTVAAEMLKAAGHHYLAGYIEGGIDLQERSEKAEAEAAEKTLAERRDEASHGFAPYLNPSRYEAVDAAAQKAIDRYLELEDRLAATP